MNQVGKHCGKRSFCQCSQKSPAAEASNCVCKWKRVKYLCFRAQCFRQEDFQRFHSLHKQVKIDPKGII